MSPDQINKMLKKLNLGEVALKEELEQRKNAMVKRTISDLSLENSVLGFLIPASTQPVPESEPEFVDYDHLVDDSETRYAIKGALSRELFAKEKALEEAISDQQQRALQEALKSAKAKRMVEIFSPSEIERCRSLSLTMSTDNKIRIKSVLKLIEENEGKRAIPTFKNIKKTLDEMKPLFTNFSSVIDEYAASLTFAGVADAVSMRVPPMILNGGHGIGKTAWCMAFAKALGLPFVKLSAGGIQSGATLVGTASHWSNAQTGAVFNLLAHQSTSSGSAVILIDEVDKVSSGLDGQSILPTLLDLLEPESSRVYRDESLGMNFNASHLIVVMTSNYPERIDPTLISRCKFRTIEAPKTEQMIAVANDIHKGINSSLPKGKRTKLDRAAVEKMVQSEMDLRALIRCVQKACSDALLSGSRVASPVFDADEEANSNKKRPIGFSLQKNG